VSRRFREAAAGGARQPPWTRWSELRRAGRQPSCRGRQITPQFAKWHDRAEALGPRPRL